MSAEFSNSKTKENLMKAFAGESQARNRYTFAAEQAKKENLYAISQVFLYTADQERAHAKVYYDLLKELSGSTIEIDGTYPVEVYDNTVKLLRAAEHNEFEEYNDVYKAFGDVAKEEGFHEAASAFYQIAEIEKTHGERFGMFAELLENNQMYARVSENKWMCLNCGNIIDATQAPPVCPVCKHNKGYFIDLNLSPYMK